MKRIIKISLAAGLTLALTATTAFSQLAYFQFDEWGNGNLPSFLQPDPTGGLPGTPVLTYVLPYSVTPGDLLISEPGATTFSDVIRFYKDAAGNNLLIFYSDRPEPGDVPPFPLADVGLPLNPQANFPPMVEIGNEGFNYVDYFPGPGMPGFDTSGVGPYQFHIISDGVVPEPGTGALAALGGGLLLLIRWHRRARQV
jgi:hypothetical protein